MCAEVLSVYMAAMAHRPAPKPAQVISEGIHWKELMDPLAENMGSWVRVVFVAFTGNKLECWNKQWEYMGI